MAPQANGSFCPDATPTAACAKLVCNTTLTGARAATCVNFSNVLYVLPAFHSPFPSLTEPLTTASGGRHQPVLSDGPWTADYVQPLNVTVPAMLAATRAMPAGQRLLRLHDVDVGLGQEPAGEHAS